MPKVPEGTAEPVDAIGPEPPMMVDGKRNIEHLRWMARSFSRKLIDSLSGCDELPKGVTPASMNDWLSNECKLCGFDAKYLLDARTDAQVFEDGVKSMLDSPDELFEKSDAFLVEAMIQMDKADKTCAEYACAPGSEAETRASLKKTMKVRPLQLKKWRARIERVRAMQDRARHKLPKGYSKSQGRALEMAHPLRYMIWVGRPGGTRPCFVVAKHHCGMAAAIYMARKGEKLQGGKWLMYKSDGAVLVCPPGHGKSALAGHVISLMISENPRLRCIFLHAQKEMAQDNLKMVASNFDTNEACGRRNLAMFPGLEIEQKSSKEFRLRLPERQKSPTILAVGMTAAKSGTDCDLFWPDDPCDQKLSEQPTERERVSQRLEATWRARKRGHKGHFEICTTTLWHHDDPTARMMKKITDNTVRFHMYVAKCGGPEDDFRALWPEEYPSSWLRNKFAQMRNPRLYATVYQCNPLPEELRRVKKLAYYLPNTEEHQRFMESSVNHISLDPTAKKDEKCDKAAFVYGAMGDVTHARDGMYSYEKELRILDAREFHASQSEGVDEVIGFAEHYSTHYIHAETRAGFDATREFFEKEGLDVICHDPSNRKKGLRLQDVAAMLDDSLQAKGFPSAVVKFPGMIGPDGTAVRDPDSPLAWVEDQILNFGVAVGDHVVDAITQLLKHLGPELRVNVGTVTERIMEIRKQSRDPRVARFVDRLFGRGENTDVNSEDARFWANQ